jgi:Rrf2 family cysteine metabolism transcriptional repressor
VNLSAKTQYACVAMLELAKQAGSGVPLQAKVIAQQHHIPSRFLVQILLQLKGAGLITSTRGAAGGYQLACNLQAITLADLRTVIEGTPDQANTPPGASWATRTVRTAWWEASQCEQRALAAITLADLLAKAPADDNMYFI